MSKVTFPSLAKPPVIEQPAPVIKQQAATLRELNLEDELLAQYHRATLLLSDAEHDETVTLAQKAQTLNGITAILAQITKSQAELYSVERVKTMEAVLIKTLKAYPHLSQAFLVSYEEALNAA